MPKAYGYIRCSHEDSAQSGLGMEHQEKVCQGYYQFLRLNQPDLEWGGFFTDPAESAYKKFLIRRPQGRKLDRALQEGDHVLFARMDRAFRWVPDFYKTKEYWDKRGITIHFVDQRLDMSTAQGKMMAGMMVVLAQWWSDYISERTREGLARKRERGELLTCDPPLGKRAVRYRGRKILLPDKKKMVLMRYVRYCIGHLGLSHMKTAHRIEGIIAKREGREPAKYEWQLAVRKCVVGRMYKRITGQDEWSEKNVA